MVFILVLWSRYYLKPIGHKLFFFDGQIFYPRFTRLDKKLYRDLVYQLSLIRGNYSPPPRMKQEQYPWDLIWGYKKRISNIAIGKTSSVNRHTISFKEFGSEFELHYCRDCNFKHPQDKFYVCDQTTSGSTNQTIILWGRRRGWREARLR